MRVTYAAVAEKISILLAPVKIVRAPEKAIVRPIIIQIRFKRSFSKYKATTETAGTIAASTVTMSFVTLSKPVYWTTPSLLSAFYDFCQSYKIAFVMKFLPDVSRR